MNKKTIVFVIVTVFCFTTINCGVSLAADKKVKAMGRGQGRGMGRGLGRGKMGGGRFGGAGTVFRPLVVAPVIARPLVSVRPRVVEVKPALPHQGPELGLSAGLFGAIPSVAGEIWFHKFLGLEGTGVKVGFRYAQGKDAGEVMRKNAVISLDGTIDLNQGPGAIFYLAGGPNYLAYTTGQKSGTLGGEVYLGVQEGSPAYGSLYAEAGYSAIRTGFSPSYKGLDLNLGFKWVY